MANVVERGREVAEGGILDTSETPPELSGGSCDAEPELPSDGVALGV